MKKYNKKEIEKDGFFVENLPKSYRIKKIPFVEWLRFLKENGYTNSQAILSVNSSIRELLRLTFLDVAINKDVWPDFVDTFYSREWLDDFGDLVLSTKGCGYAVEEWYQKFELDLKQGNIVTKGQSQDK